MITKKQTMIVSLLLFILFSLLGIYWTRRENLSSSYGQGTILNRFSAEMAAALPAAEITPEEVPIGLIKLSQDFIASAANATNKEAVDYYEEKTGKTYEINLENRKRSEISEAALPRSLRPVNFDKAVRAAAFSADEKRVALFQSQGGTGVVTLANPDGSVPKNILSTRLKEVKLLWPLDDAIVLEAANQDGGEDIFSLSLKGELKKIFGYDRPLEILWAYGKNEFLFSPRAGSSQLYFWTENSAIETGLQTPASLCAWSIDNQTVICAVSDRRNQGRADLVKIDIASGKLETIKEGLDVRPKKIFLSHLEKYLIIIDSQGQLYAVRL